MQQDEHRGLVARVKPNWIPDGESKEGDGVLRNQVCGGLVGKYYVGGVSALVIQRTDAVRGLRAESQVATQFSMGETK